MKKAFIIMPFRAPFNSYYNSIYKPALEAVGFNTTRADELYGSRPILEDIQKSIKDADLILCDMSTRNPNVFYELGLAHAIGKPVILVSNNMDDVPFDLRHIRTIIYKTEEAGWEAELSKSIANYGAEKNLRVYPEPMNIHNKGVELKSRKEYQAPFNQRFADVQCLDVHGYSLGGLWASYIGFLYEKAKAGCKIRILLLDPLSSTPEIVSSLTEAKGLLKNDIERSVESFKHLLDMRNVELRYTAVPTPFGLVIKDSKEDSGIVEVDLYAYRVSAMDRPKLVITKEIDAERFTFFVEQFEKLWEDARVEEFK